MYKTIVFEKEDKVATITLNRPDKLNAIDMELHDELLEALDEVSVDEEIFALIIAAAGRAFCTGHDAATVHEGSEEFRKHKIIRKMVDFEKPIIAVVNGYALAEGFQIALASDIIIASESAQFGAIGAVLGSICNYAVFALPRVVGRNRAADMLFTGRHVGGKEAYELGLVNRLVPPKQLMKAAREMTDTIMKNAPLSVKYSRQALRKGEYNAEAEEWVYGVVQLLARTEDQKEAFSAILEKRSPFFKGR